ncbi:uncharacterized protein LOC118189317 isoform X2 [Stegodyphus dumicola]|uniref:uncharacterized protein LOC118189317 isoform X2 n=1 Tax=Stegodyphus dumicola TaxID=202533 RepID=UPI0015A8ED94|nr:uncharacterized protein LOC118189317 isoform X2 [Stegodyphus dumicola]
MEPHTILITTLLAGAVLFTLGNLEYFQKVEISRDGWGETNNSHRSTAVLSGDSKVDINEFLIGVIENFREDMLTGIPELKVPILDPFKAKKPLKVDVEDSKASVHGNFTNVLVEGLSGFVLDYLRADLQNLSLRFNLTIPWIKAVGNYSLNGKIIKIIPLRGEGEFWVESFNLSVAAKASIDNSDENHLQLSKDFDVEMDFDKVQMHLDNFLGGGRWTEVLLKILNDISKDLFRKFLPLLKGELNKSLLKVINKHLMKLPITSIMPGSNADEYIDQILLNVRNYIRDNNLDPMALPDYVSNFTKEVMFVTVTGEAKMYDGWLWGISSIHRTDECDFNSNRTFISVSAHLGLNDLRLSYKGHAKFMSWGPSIIVGGKVKKVAFYFEIEQMNKKRAKPNLKEFEIVEMSTIWVELSGLGPLTWIMKWLMTGITKLLEDFFVEKVTFYIREYMQNEFQKLSFPV